MADHVVGDGAVGLADKGAGQGPGPEYVKYAWGPGRQTEPRQWTPYMGGGIGVSPKRRMQDPLGQGQGGLEDRVRSNPEEVMLDLPSVHPSVGLAQWNALRLMFQKDKWGFRVVGDDGKPTPDGSEADVELRRVLRSSRKGGALPLEVGSPAALVSQLSSHLLLTGRAMLEAEPQEEELAGARRLWPVDTTTVTFGRASRGDDMQPFQRQRWPRQLYGAGDPQPVQSAGSIGPFGVAVTGWVPLDPLRTFWATIDAGVDDAYGLAPYSSALNEVLADLALMRDLRDAVHNAAWPRLDIGVNLTELHKVAVEVMRITDPVKAAKWVTQRFKETVEYAKELAADDNVVHDSNGKVDTKQPGSFSGLEGVLAFLRQRLVQALKSLPTLMGVNDGSTFNYTSVEWAIYAAGLEAVRDIVLDLVAEALSFCLRLKGISATVVGFAEKIRTNDSLVDANTEEVKLRNAATKEALGFETHDEAAQGVTGKKAVGPAMPGVLEAMVGKVSEADGDQSKGGSQTGASQGNPNAGKSTEERAASKK